MPHLTNFSQAEVEQHQIGGTTFFDSSGATDSKVSDVQNLKAFITIQLYMILDLFTSINTFKGKDMTYWIYYFKEDEFESDCVSVQESEEESQNEKEAQVNAYYITLSKN